VRTISTLEFVFRPTGNTVPSNWKPGIHWLVEAHSSADDLSYPVGLAWVSDFFRAPIPIVSLDFILVPDHYRRLGVATALVRKCRERWPDIVLTEAISEGGEGLMRSLDRLPGDTN
jgi:GNAT superfamily N-acetyltransferase